MNCYIINKKLSDHPLYLVWQGMKSRCYKPSADYYERYGGRGICICKLWLKSFLHFYKWAIKNGWAKGKQIDRKNNNGNYTPNNCRFVTPKQNANNRSDTKYFKINGVKRPFTEWCELNGLKPSMVAKRLKRGYSIEESLKKTLPPLTANQSKKIVELRNLIDNSKIIFDSVNDCAKYLNLHQSSVSHALKEKRIIGGNYRVNILGFFKNIL